MDTTGGVSKWQHGEWCQQWQLDYVSPDNWLNFQSEYVLNADDTYNNDDADVSQGLFCTTMTREALEEQYNYDGILLWPGVFDDVGVTSSIYPNFFNGTIIDSHGCPYINDDQISNTQMLPHTILQFSMSIKNSNIDKSIDHYDALCCKFW